MFSEGVTSVGCHPLVEIVDIELDIADDVEHFGDADFAFGLAGIFQHRRDDLVGMGLDRGLQLRELRLALIGGGGLHVPLMRPLQGENLFNGGHGAFLHPIRGEKIAPTAR